MEQSAIIKTWNLPIGAELILKDGEIVKFLGMDGMYGKWKQRGEFKIGSFDKIEARDGKFYAL